LTKNSYANFGDAVWEKLRAQPLGSLTKRELELAFLRAAADADLVELRAENLAATCHILISRAHGYLTDLALREAPLSDADAVKTLAGLLKDTEVVRDDAHFSIPLHDASLRIWLERKMALLRLNSGDTLRRDHVKLTPNGLAKILGSSEGIISPYDAIRELPAELSDAEWAIEAKKSWKKRMGWIEAMGIVGNTASIAQVVLPVLFRSFSA
jgi:hypothetical protein